MKQILGFTKGQLGKIINLIGPKPQQGALTKEVSSSCLNTLIPMELISLMVLPGKFTIKQ